MSIYTDMVPVTILCNQPKESLSGAPCNNYVAIEDTQASIYKNDSFKSVQSVKYEQSTHNALTFYKGFENGKEYRLQIGSTIMDVTYFNIVGRFTTLLLKEIDFYE